MAKRKKLRVSSIEMRMSHRYRSYAVFAWLCCLAQFEKAKRDSSERFHQALIDASSKRQGSERACFETYLSSLRAIN